MKSNSQLQTTFNHVPEKKIIRKHYGFLKDILSHFREQPNRTTFETAVPQSKQNKSL